MTFFQLSLVQLSHFMRPQAEFWICCTVFYSLENGKKSLKETLKWCGKMPYNVDQIDSIYEKKLL
jgi:uncharacterized Fe-S cluster-containing radical SAM superfamily protein